MFLGGGKIFHNNNRRLPLFFLAKISTAILGLLSIDIIKSQGKSHNAIEYVSLVEPLSLRTGMSFTDVVFQV